MSIPAKGLSCRLHLWSKNWQILFSVLINNPEVNCKEHDCNWEPRGIGNRIRQHNPNHHGKYDQCTQCTRSLKDEK